MVERGTEQQILTRLINNKKSKFILKNKKTLLLFLFKILFLFLYLFIIIYFINN